MRRRLAVILVLTTWTVAAVAAPAASGQDPGTYDLRMDAPNRGTAANGDVVEITCSGGQGLCGTFTWTPQEKTITASGEFVHEDSAGNFLGGGTWTATDLLAYDSYGCGVVESVGATLPPNFCGGMLRMRVVLTTPGGQFDGILTAFCIVGEDAPSSHDEPPEEGATLNIIGAINFNQVGGGQNVYVKH